MRWELGPRQRHARRIIQHAELLGSEPGALAGTDHGDAAKIGERESRRAVAAVKILDQAVESGVLRRNGQHLPVGGRRSAGSKIEREGEDFAHERAAGALIGLWIDAGH